MLSQDEVRHRQSLGGRIGGYRLAATRDPQEYTAAARAAFLKTFEDRVDPDRSLPEAERQRRAEAARKAHFAEMALRRHRGKGGES